MPRRGVLIEDGLQAQVQFFTLTEQFVQFDFTEDAAQRGLCQLRGRVQKIGYLDNRQPCIKHAEENDRIHLHGHVVACH